MSQITDAQVDKLRIRPHNTKLWLSIYEPDTIFAGRVNDATIEKGERFIDFDGGSGDKNSILRNMMMYVGTSAGANDKGKIRVKRLVDADTILVGENSHIDWADDDYITVVDFFEINPTYPRIIEDPADDTKTLWYKDYDVAYPTDTPHQDWNNVGIGTSICMGSHYAGFLSTGSCSVYYTSTGTYNYRSETLSYEWIFEGATTTGSVAADPGWIAYDTPGHYTTRLWTTTPSGTVDYSYRHISIYDHPSEGTDIPVLSWELQSLTEDREGGGQTAKIRLRQDIDNPNLVDGALVILFAEDWYDGEKVSIGSNSPNRETIFFVGYVLSGSIKYNWLESYVDFSVGSPTEVMKDGEGFSISVQDSRDPLGWYASDPENYPSPWMLLKDMDVKRAIFHYLKWHTTVTYCVDYQPIFTDEYIQYFDADRNSMYDAVNTLMAGTLLGRVASDRQGKIWAEGDVYVDDSPHETSNLSITKRDWVDTPDITERLQEDISYIEAGGIAYYPGSTTGTYTPLLAGAPGVSPAYRGSLQRMQGLALYSQGHLNDIAGRLYATKNAQYPAITMNIAGNYRNFDIAPQQQIPISIPAGDTVRGVAISANFFVDSIMWKYDPKRELLSPTVTFHEIDFGFDADTITIPIEPPEQTESGGTTNIPKLQVPPYNPPITPVPSAGGADWIHAVFSYGECSTGSEPLLWWSNSGNGPGIWLEDGHNTSRLDTSFVCANAGSLKVYLVFYSNIGTPGDVALSWQLWRARNGSTDILTVDNPKPGGGNWDHVPLAQTGEYLYFHDLTTYTVLAGDIIRIEVVAKRSDVEDTTDNDVCLWNLVGEYI